MQAVVEMRKRQSAAPSTVLRPYLSLSGPKSNCPAAKPKIHMARPICMADGAASKSVVIAGRAGRYISVTKGGNAARAPRVEIEQISASVRSLHRSYDLEVEVKMTYPFMQQEPVERVSTSSCYTIIENLVAFVAQRY